MKITRTSLILPILKKGLPVDSKIVIQANIRDLLVDQFPSLEVVLDSIPYLDVEVYQPELLVGYNEPLWVVPYQYSLDGSEIKDFIGYNSLGQTRLFAASDQPDFPVVIIKISERPDFLLEAFVTQAKVAVARATFAWDGSKVVRYKLKGIYLTTTWDTFETDAEVYSLWTIGQTGIKQPYADVNRRNQWYAFDANIFEFYNTPENSVIKVELWEEDFNFWTYIPKTVSFNTTIGLPTLNADGTMGTKTFVVSGGYTFDASNCLSSADDLFGATMFTGVTRLDADSIYQAFLGSAYLKLSHSVY